VIYLIGGAPRCGKTTIAQALANERGCSLMPTDYLMSAFNRYVPEGERATQLLPGQSNDVRYSQHSTEEIVESYHRRAQAAAPGITSIVEYAHNDRRDLILEGFHLEPWLIRDLQTRYGDGICGVLLICLDPAKLSERLRDAEDATGWVARTTRDATTIPKIAAMVVAYSAKLQAQATELGLPIVNGDLGLETATSSAVNGLARAG
jgi:2-phosphoglycerate kinase